ncbi:MAG: fumarate hydratase subunit alpha [Archaeoglobi archaeon]|nr:fumarate hydratase [Candidatus Mnemosynella bozhongmuii]MDK2781877.1 fumarate hydratase subunit alpha [Archaeoglobi archaeon]
MEREDVIRAIVHLFKKAETSLGEDVKELLRKALEEEEDDVARRNLETIIKNSELAEKMGLPICQDTGIPVVFIELGRELSLEFNLREAVEEGVRRATEEIPLRANAVHPLTRENSGDNTGVQMPQLHFELVEGDEMKITVLPKGAGSENVSKLRMMLPSEVSKIERFILESVVEAMGKPCPPVFLGIGIGGSFDGSAKLAKKALLRDAREMSEEEKRIRDMINELGIGPMGLGGRTTALGVYIEMAHCHTASLPVALNFQCWAHRKASTVLR